MNEIIKQVEDLNLKTYELFCKLDRYKDKMTETAYKYMADKLFLIYQAEFEKLYGDYDIERTRKRYELKERRAEEVPRARRIWWTLFIRVRKNRAATLIDEKTEIEAEGLFKEIEKQIAAERIRLNLPQNPEKTGSKKQDQRSDDPQEAPKTGISHKGKEKTT